MRGDTPAGGGLMVCLLWWLLSLHMILECQPSYFKQEYVWWMEGYVLQALMQHPWRAKVEVWKQQSSRWLVSIPSLLNFGGASALCLSCHCCSPVTAVLWRLLVPELTLIGVWRLHFFFFFPMHKSCQLQPNCILFRQTVSGAMQMSFEMWRSGLYLSVNCLSGTDI